SPSMHWGGIILGSMMVCFDIGHDIRGRPKVLQECGGAFLLRDGVRPHACSVDQPSGKIASMSREHREMIWAGRNTSRHYCIVDMHGEATRTGSHEQYRFQQTHIAAHIRLVAARGPDFV